MLPDTRIIARAGALEVGSQRREIMFRDGSAVWLHPVHRAGVPQCMVYALAEVRCFTLFELRSLSPAIDLALRQAPERDQGGVLFYSLRERYPSSSAFKAAAKAHNLARIATVAAADEPLAHAA